MAYRRQPTAWPNAGYYILRLMQTIGSIGVCGSMAYFIFKLLKDGFGIPYEFIILQAVAIVSLVNIIGSTVAKCCNALNPNFALGLDLFCLIGWGVGFGLLTKAMGPTLFSGCNNGTWGPAKGWGQWVCKVYKATWGLALIALVGFFAALFLDFIVARRRTHKYVPANPKSMQQQKARAAPTDYHHQDTSYGAGGIGAQG